MFLGCKGKRQMIVIFKVHLKWKTFNEKRSMKNVQWKTFNEKRTMIICVLGLCFVPDAAAPRHQVRVRRLEGLGRHLGHRPLQGLLRRVHASGDFLWNQIWTFWYNLMLIEMLLFVIIWGFRWFFLCQLKCCLFYKTDSLNRMLSTKWKCNLR